jgi:Aspartyl protease
VRIEGRDARADFDLGNGSLPLLGAEFARRYGLLDDGRSIGREKGGGLGGAIERKTLKISQLQIGDRVFRNIKVAVDDNANASDFNMGTSLLREFHIVTDFANHQLWLSQS